MRMTPNKVKAESVPSKPANSKPPDIATASVPDTLAVLHVNPDTGLTQAEVDIRLKEHGYNEVAEKKSHPILMFLGKFWGLSAWMLELIMVLSAVLGKFSDLAVVGALLAVVFVLLMSAVLVTRLSAAEDATTMAVLCVDKTGTITMNQLADFSWSRLPQIDPECEKTLHLVK